MVCVSKYIIKFWCNQVKTNMSLGSQRIKSKVKLIRGWPNRFLDVIDVIPWITIMFYYYNLILPETTLILTCFVKFKPIA